MTTPKLASLASLLLVAAFAAPLAAQVVDEPPTTPTGLVANVYGPTAGGIRWERSSDDRGAVRGYEIARNGVVLEERDALSLVERDLAPGTTYRYGITAIDGAGQRSGTATVSLTTPGGAPPAPGLAAPSGLRGDVYSSTAVELFWSRSPTFGLRYEIVRDGEVVATTDGTSHFDTGLTGGTAYTYEVVAIDRDGRRSSPSTVELTTAGRPSADGPDALTGLRADVYSSTAAELFWSRPTGVALRYEVVRDGAVLATTDGTSYFDDALAGGTTYTYEVVAIDRDGRRSSPSTVELTTAGGAPTEPPGDDPFAEPDPDAATLVARLGYPAALELADDLVSMSYLTLYYDIDRALSRLLSPGANYAEPATRACPGGGTASGLAQPFLIDVDLDACTIEGRTLSGALRREAEFIVFGQGDRQEVVLTFDDLLIEAGEEGSLRLSGTSTRNDSTAVENGPLCSAAPRVIRRVDNRIDAARLERGGVVSTIAGARWEQSDTSFPGPVDEFGQEPCVPVSTLFGDGASTVESARFGPAGATFEKAADLVRDPRDDPAFSGDARLAADFGDGSTLAVTAVPGSDGEAQVDIVADGVAVSFTDDYRFEAREDIPTIIGD